MSKAPESDVRDWTPTIPPTKAIMTADDIDLVISDPRWAAARLAYLEDQTEKQAERIEALEEANTRLNLSLNKITEQNAKHVRERDEARDHAEWIRAELKHANVGWNFPWESAATEKQNDRS